MCLTFLLLNTNFNFKKIMKCKIYIIILIFSLLHFQLIIIQFFTRKKFNQLIYVNIKINKTDYMCKRQYN